MKIDLFKLNNYNQIEIEENIAFEKEIYEGMGIRDIKNTRVSGIISIGVSDEVKANLNIKGTFVLPCAITLDDVFYDFETNIDEILGNFNDFYDKRQNTLDILPFLWENIVSEVPIRVVKEGISETKLSGDGWEVVRES